MTDVALEAAARSAVLITVAWAALALLRPRNPHLLKAVWTTVVIASLGMPLLMQIHIAPALAAPVLQWTIRPDSGASTRGVSMQLLGALAYLVPAFLLLSRFASGWTRLLRLCREGQALTGPCADGLDVRVSATIPSPATFGTTILLPTDFSSWSARKLAAVMAHERAHVLHRDCYVLWIARLHACVFWFNPLAWWVVRRLTALAEQTSDEAAVDTLGNGIDYAEILLGLSMQRASGLATAMASSDLPARVERILSGTRLSPSLGRRQLLLVLAAVLPAAALAASPLQRTAGASARSSQTTAAKSATASAEPRVVSWGPLSSFYPREALHKRVEGMVELAVTLDSAGRATDTQILTEYPLNMGFGAAASAAAHAMQYSNPTGQPVTFSIRVKFTPSDPPDEADPSA